MINVAKVMSDQRFVRSFVVHRPTAPAFDGSGVLVAGDVADIPMVGAVQPAGPADLKVLPQGTDLSTIISVWSRQQLVCDDGNSVLSDVVEVAGQKYRVIKVEDWSAYGYWRVFCQGFVQ